MTFQEVGLLLSKNYQQVKKLHIHSFIVESISKMLSGGIHNYLGANYPLSTRLSALSQLVEWERHDT